MKCSIIATYCLLVILLFGCATIEDREYHIYAESIPEERISIEKYHDFDGYSQWYSTQYHFHYYSEALGEICVTYDSTIYFISCDTSHKWSMGVIDLRKRNISRTEMRFRCGSVGGLFLTNNFLFFVNKCMSNTTFHRFPADTLVQEVLMIPKSNLCSITNKSFPNEDILEIKELNNSLYVTTNRIEARSQILDRFLNWIEPRCELGFYYGTEDFYEYQFDSICSLISRKKINKPK